MRKKIIIGNWKMNKTVSETKLFISEFASLYPKYNTNIHPNLDLGLAVSFTNLCPIGKIKEIYPPLIIGAQNLSYADKGAFTGEISASMLADAGAKFVLIGHSERRQYFHELDEEINKKIKIAIANNLTPVLCVGETLEQYEKDLTKEVIANQLSKDLDGVDLTRIIIAYEPIWAIGTGKTASAQIAQDICKFIRSKTNNNTIIQYGGSVSPKNIAELMLQPDIDGALVGGASLNAEDFLKLAVF